MAAKILALFYIAHHIGDYYLQNGIIAKKKASSYLFTLVHCALYSLPFILMWIFLFEFNTIILSYIIVIVSSHIPVDLAKCYLNIHYKELIDKGYTVFGNFHFVYILDQVIHINIIYIAVFWSVQVIEKMDVPILNGVSYETLFTIFYIFMMYQSSYVSVRVLFTENSDINNFYCLKDTLWRVYGLFIGLSIAFNGYLVGIFWVASSYLLKRGNQKFGRRTITQEFCDFTFGSGLIAVITLALLELGIKIMML